MRWIASSHIERALRGSGRSVERACMNDHGPLRPNLWDYAALGPLLLAIATGAGVVLTWLHSIGTFYVLRLRPRISRHCEQKRQRD
jgi:hypothetical protein